MTPLGDARALGSPGTAGRARIRWAWVCGGAASLLAALGYAGLSASASGPSFGDALIAGTVYAALGWYFAALALMVAPRAIRGAESLGQSHAAQWCWTWGLLAYLAHVAAAFHYFHDWSHAHAVEYTRRASGFGGGVFVSYAFTVLWAADASWWWVRPRAYAARPRWAACVVHGFMALIVFNGAVVFADGPVRWVSLAAFAALGVAWLSGTRDA